MKPSLLASVSGPNGMVEQKRRGPGSNRCFDPVPFSELPAAERRARARRMRLVWACQADELAADCAQRLLEQGEALMRSRNGGRP